jgi:hypothetical protein
MALSLAASAAVYAVSRSTPMAAAAFLSGVFIDLDHIYDYVREYGMRLDVRFFFHSFSKTLYRKVVVPLHAWEFVALLAVMAIVSHGNSVVVGTLIGAALHLIADQMTNGICASGYFFAYRMANRFATERIFPGKGRE